MNELKPRFRIELRERRLRDGTSDRWWTILDRKHKGMRIAEIHSNYPDSGKMMGDYCARLNKEHIAAWNTRQKQGGESK